MNYKPAEPSYHRIQGLQAVSSEGQRCLAEFVSLEKGPVDMYLGRKHLQIVDRLRDMPGVGPNTFDPYIRAFIIDPTGYDRRREIGYKAIRNLEIVRIGRDNPGSFEELDSTVSRKHAEISIVQGGHWSDFDSPAVLCIKDLSSFGTYIRVGESAVAATTEITLSTKRSP